LNIQTFLADGRIASGLGNSAERTGSLSADDGDTDSWSFGNESGVGGGLMRAGAALLSDGTGVDTTVAGVFTVALFGGAGYINIAQ